MSHPYRGLEPRAFWKKAVAERHFMDITDLATPGFKIGLTDRVVTAGSCFAQHISKRLRAQGFRFVDSEPAPPKLPDSVHQAFGYGVFSARYGNIYTTRQLIQLWQRAYGRLSPQDNIWESNGRFYDPFRPSIEPNGFSSADELLKSQEAHLTAVRTMFRNVDVFVFTLGLTEVWVSKKDGSAYPTCPGTQAGLFDPTIHEYKNLTCSEVVEDLANFIRFVRRKRPAARFIFTVSPVPLAATASGEHVLTATTYSKSVLRAAAGEIAQKFEGVTYFPSYEIITSPVFRGAFYENSLREVRPEGVEFVMRQFFEQFCEAPELINRESIAPKSALDDEDILCDEQLLSSFA